MLFQLLRKPVAKNQVCHDVFSRNGLQCQSLGCPYNVLFAFKFHITLKQLMYLFMNMRMHLFLAKKVNFKHPNNTSIFNHQKGSEVSRHCLCAGLFCVDCVSMGFRGVFHSQLVMCALLIGRCSFYSTHANKRPKSCWLILLDVTHNKSLQESIQLFCTRGFWSLQLFKAASRFLGEGDDGKPGFFLTDTCLFCQKETTNILMSCWCFYHWKLSWQTSSPDQRWQGLDTLPSPQNIQNCHRLAKLKGERWRQQHCQKPTVKSTAMNSPASIAVSILCLRVFHLELCNYFYINSIPWTSSLFYI